VGVTNESPFLIDLWSRAAVLRVATYQSAGPACRAISVERTLGVR